MIYDSITIGGCVNEDGSSAVVEIRGVVTSKGFVHRARGPEAILAGAYAGSNIVTSMIAELHRTGLDYIRRGTIRARRI